MSKKTDQHPQTNVEAQSENKEPEKKGTEVVGEIQSHVNDMRAFSDAISHDVAKLDKDNSSEAQGAKEGLLGLQKEVVAAEHTLWTQVAAIVSSPIDTVKGYFEARKESALAIPDNPKIIAEIKAEISKIRTLRRELVKKITDKDKKLYSSDVQHKVFDDKTLDGNLESAWSLYSRASKKEQEQWKDAESAFDELFADKVQFFIEQGKFPEAFVAWGKLSEARQDKEVVFVADIILKHHQKTMPEGLASNGDVSNIFERQIKFNHWKNELLNNIPVPYVRAAVESDVSKLFERTFTAQEILLLDKPPECLAVLSRIDKKLQSKILTEWGRNSYDWTEVLLHPKAEEIIGIFDQFPVIKNSLTALGLGNLLNKYSAEEFSVAFEKVSDRFPSYANLTMATIEGSLAIASSESFDRTIFNSLQPIKIGSIGALARIYSGADLEKFLTKESLSDFSDIRANYIFPGQDGDIDFDKGLSDIATKFFSKAPDHRYNYSVQGVSGKNINLHEGLQGRVGAYLDFSKFLKFIPESVQDNLLSVIKPPENGVYENISEGVSLETVQSFCKFHTEVAQDAPVSYDVFTKQLNYFTAEKSVFIDKGIELFRDFGLLDKVKTKDYALILFELAGKTEDENINELVKKFIGTNEKAVYAYGDRFEMSERNEPSIKNIYKFGENCQRIFGVDTAEVVSYLGLSSLETKVVFSYLNGELIEKDYMDLPAVEGSVGIIANALEASSAGLEKFLTLDSKQKRNYLEARKVLHCEIADILVYIESGEIESILDFVKETGINLYNINKMMLMVHSKERSVFNYFKGVIGDGTEIDKINQIVSKCEALRNEGLPDDYFQKSHSKSDEHLDRDEFENFLSMPAKFIVDAVQILKKYGFPHRLKDVTYLDQDESAEQLDLRVRYVKVQGDSYVSRHGHTIEKEVLEEMEQRLEQVKEVCKDVTGYRAYRLITVPKKVWPELLQHEDILRLYVDGAHSKFPGFSVPLADLQNPLFWKFACPKEIYGDDSLRARHLQYLKNASQMRMVVREVSSAEDWVKNYDLLDRARVLVGDEILVGVDPSYLNEIIKMNEDEIEKFKQFVTIFSVNKDSYYVKSAFDFFKNLAPEKINILRDINKICGSILTVDMTERMSVALKKFSTAAELVDAFDLSLKDYFGDQDWKEYRAGGIKIDRKLYPNLDKRFLKGLSSDLVEIVDGLNSCSKNELQRLEQVAAWTIKTGAYYPLNFLCPSLLTIVKHQNFEVIFDFTKNEALENIATSLPYLDDENLTAFCDLISEDGIERVGKMVAYGNITLKEVVPFLNNPQDADKFIDCAKKMHEIFGKKISIHDYYLMDVEEINQTLNDIKENCLSDITEENLKRILAFSSPETANQISILLASFDKRQSISVEATLDKLLNVPIEFQWPILESKVVNFGWDLLDHTDRLYKLGLTEAQIEILWSALLESSGTPNKSLDVRTTTVLLKCVAEKKWHGGVNIISQVFKNHTQPLESYRSVFITHKNDFLNTMGYWYSLPEEIKNDDEYLGMLLDEKTTAFIKNIKEIKNDFIINNFDRVKAKVVETGPEASYQLLLIINEKGITITDSDVSELLSVIAKGDASIARDVLFAANDGKIVLSADQESGFIDKYIISPGYSLPDSSYNDASKKALYDKMSQRADDVVQNWRVDTAKAITVMSKLLKQNIFTSAHMDILHLMVTEKDLQFTDVSPADVHRIFIDYLIHIDPTIRETLNNSKKLGRLKDVVVGKIIEYIQSISQGGEISQSDLQIKIRKKLQEISRLFGSTETKESEKRLVFLDMYNLQECNDPAVKDLSKEEIAAKLKNDIEEVILLSGSETQIQNLQRELELTDDPELKRSIEEKILFAKEILRKSDVRNRAITDFLPLGALTHGLSSEHISLALEYGNLTGELLGPNTKRDMSGLLGVDTSRLVATGLEDKNFSARYKSLMNYNYGDVMMVYGNYESEDRPPYYSGVIGNDHYLVRAGIPTSEITTIILRKNEVLPQMKKDVATKGIYIPLVDTQGNVLFSAEEFDQMKVFYSSLSKKGYPRTVIDNVYEYSSTQKGDKHQIVMDAAVAHLRENESATEPDLAILTDFLRSNDLNERPAEWYEDQSFQVLYDFIKKTVGRKKRKKAREVMLGADFASDFESRVVHQQEQTVAPERQRNAFIDAFFDKQLPFIYDGDDRAVQQVEFEDDMTSMLFREKNAQDTLEIADRFSKFKKEFMGKLWASAWDTILSQGSDEQKEKLAEYKKYIVPAVVGSVGRGEVVLGSDLDYLLYVDNVSQEITDEQLDYIKNFINQNLGPAMNRMLEQNGIHADAGLAKADRQPFTLLSTIRDFKIDLTLSRQQEEPTTVIDSEALFEDQSGVVEKAKELLLVENASAHYLDSYIAKDLEFGSGSHPGYQEQFEKLYNSVASGDLISRVKESLQRAVTFKLYYLIFEGMNSGKIPKDMAKDMPASIVGKIDLLEKNKILSKQEGNVCRELAALAYKLRFVGEVYSEEAKQEKGLADKVKNVTFRLDDISYDERVRLVGLLKDFKSTVLYK